MQLNDEGGGRLQKDDPWLMTTESMVTSYCESADNSLALMSQHSDKVIVTKHLLLRHHDVIQFRVGLN